MASYKFKTPNLLRKTSSLKRVDRHIFYELPPNDAGGAVPKIRVINGIVRGEWTGDSDDRRIGHVVDNMVIEWHYDYKPEKQPTDTIQDYVNLVRHQILWYESDTETFDLDVIFQEIFTTISGNPIDIHNPLNIDKLSSNELISFYDKTFTLAPLQFGNNTEQPLLEDPPIWQVYSVMADKNIFIDEGSIDLTAFYRGGLRTVYGSGSEFDIQSGILLEVFRTKYNVSKVFVEGYRRLFYSDV